ncbi:polypeptide-transport-associated domain protein FtsQ-type [Chondrocystis sp. NIES-4102]|nr:polypeptide-transport-associated domain protein FtsQ-type [Chondrocystis sp. NIES-4102]
MSAFPPPKLKYKLTLVDIQDRRLARISLWRTCLLITSAICLCLLPTLPYWQIKYPSQIQINGEKLVGKRTIYTALSFDYPQFIWLVNGLNLTRKIQLIPSIETVNITKQIIPPHLIISLQEKKPVAIATYQEKIGFLAIDGQWIDQQFYENINVNSALPKLQVLNYQSRHQDHWKSIYQLISLHPELKITTVQWDENSNLYLYTKIGKVFLGSDLSQLEKQFKIMLKLQNLPSYVDNSKIAYIDLSNPNLNIIQKY